MRFDDADFSYPTDMIEIRKGVEGQKSSRCRTWKPVAGEFLIRPRIALKYEFARDTAKAARIGGYYHPEPVRSANILNEIDFLNTTSMEQLQAWYDSPEYRAPRELAHQALRRRLLFVEGLPAS